MKKYLALLCATMLCVCCVALAACGGSSSSSAASASGSSASSASAEVSYVGEWKFASAETGGVTLAGDLSAMFGDSMNFSINLKADGTGTLTFSSDSTDVKWTETDKGITVTPVESASSSASAASTSSETEGGVNGAGNAIGDLPETLNESGAIDFTLKDGILSTVIESDGTTATLNFTADGTMPGMLDISTANAKPITSKDALVGNWKLAGINMMGLMAYGDADAIAAMSGGSNVSLSFSEDGNCDLSGSIAPYTVSADGAAITEGDTSIPIMALGDDIIMDMSSILGMDMIMLFSK